MQQEDRRLLGNLLFATHWQPVERGAMLLDGDEAPFRKMGTISDQNVFEYLDDVAGPATFATQPHHGRATKAQDSHERVKVSI